MPRKPIKSPPKKSVKKKPFRKEKWKDEFYLDVYLAAKGGMTDTEVAHAIGVNPLTLTRWRSLRPALEHSLSEARATNDATFKSYVYNRLPRSLKEIWGNLFEHDDNGREQPVDMERAEAILERHGAPIRKHLFIYALVHCSFNPSAACQLLNIPSKCLNDWKEDPEFVDLLNEIHYHKKNFFEEHLVRKVASGDASAIIFANKTFNKDRGYNEKIDVDLSVKEERSYSVLDLNLSLDCRREILEKMKEQEQKLLTQEKSPIVIDAEFEVAETSER